LNDRLWQTPPGADHWHPHGWMSCCRSANRCEGCTSAKARRRPECRRSALVEPTFHRRASSGRPFNLYSAIVDQTPGRQRIKGKWTIRQSVLVSTDNASFGPTILCPCGFVVSWIGRHLLSKADRLNSAW